MTNNGVVMTVTEDRMGLVSRRSKSPSHPILPLVDQSKAFLTPLAAERSKLRKLPKKNSSYNAQQRGEFSSSSRRSTVKSILLGTDSAPVLPDRSAESLQQQEEREQQRPITRSARSAIFRATERGHQDVLPVMSPSAIAPLRARAKSSDQLHAHLNQSISLRSRKRSSANKLDDGASHFSDDRSIDISPGLFEDEIKNFVSIQFETDDLSRDAQKKKMPSRFFLPQHAGFLSKLKTDQTWLNMKPPQFLTLMLLLAITCFVAGSYRQVLAATDQIEQVRMEESKLLVHLHKVEQQALQLAENLKRMSDRNDVAAANGGATVGGVAAQQLAESALVDGDLIRAQIDKLRDMEAELDHEVRTLRKKIQLSAKQELNKLFGEGIIQVLMEIDFPNEEDAGGAVAAGSSRSAPLKNVVTMRLWYDTPHTGWTFLQQVDKGLWNGAAISLQQGRALLVEPNIYGAALKPKLDFVEPTERGHDQYTVTLTDNNLAINLQDNKQFHTTQEACVGVIFEGFDALHNVVRQVVSHTIRIKKISYAKMTRGDSNALF